jgi:hypothetical protein
MFGFGLQKLLVLALLVGAVWYGFKYFGRLDESRKKVEKAARKAAQKAAGMAAGKVAEPEPQAEPLAQDMERCETCGDFVAVRGVNSCGREACPYPG